MSISITKDPATKSLTIAVSNELEYLGLQTYIETQLSKLGPLVGDPFAQLRVEPEPDSVLHKAARLANLLAELPERPRRIIDVLEAMEPRGETWLDVTNLKKRTKLTKAGAFRTAMKELSVYAKRRGLSFSDVVERSVIKGRPCYCIAGPSPTTDSPN